MARSLKWDNYVIANINSWYNNSCKQHTHTHTQTQTHTHRHRHTHTHTLYICCLQFFA